MKAENPTFEQAMEAALLWCSAWERDELSDEVLAERVGELISTEIGARGFFVIGLASDCPLLDRLPDVLVMKLRASGKSVIDLTIRNLAMSSAMANHHGRAGSNYEKNRSERVTARCQELLRLLEPIEVKNKLEDLLEATKGRGDYFSFIERHKYDKEQKIAIASKIIEVAAYKEKQE